MEYEEFLNLQIELIQGVLDSKSKKNKPQDHFLQELKKSLSDQVEKRHGT